MATTKPTGKAIMRAALELFRQDRQMIWLPVMATATTLLAFAVITAPVALITGHSAPAILVGFACASFVATAATVIFNVALCFAAADRIEGRTPTVQGSIAKAWGRKGVIVKWAILAAVVGTAIRAVEQRLGLVGRIVGLGAGLAWAVATFLVVPVLAFEDVGPIEAVKRSSAIFKARFGTVARGGLRFGLRFLGLSLGALAVTAFGVFISFHNLYAVGIPVAVVGFALLVGVGMYAMAASMYLRTILYRFATDLPIPDVGVDVGGAFGTA